MSVYKKLQEARVRLQNTKMQKTGLNKFAGFSYWELGDFLPHIQVIFNEIGLCGVVSFAADIATLTITDINEGGVITITSPNMDVSLKGCIPIQGLGAAQTYLRRYLWVNALEIVEHDALDSTVGDDTKLAQKAKVAQKKDYSEATTALRECETMESLQTIWGGLTSEEKTELVAVKDEVKNKLPKDKK